MDYVPLKEAAEKHNVNEQVLTQLISAGMISAKKEAGEILVAVEKDDNGDQKTKEEMIVAKFSHLKEQPITLTEAAEKYGIPRSTIKNWVYRSNYLAPLIPESYPAKFDEAEVAYLSDIYHKRQKTGSRAPLLDERGLPYKLKLPDLAQYRRGKKLDLAQK